MSDWRYPRGWYSLTPVGESVMQRAAASLRESRERVERIRCQVASMRDQDATRLAMHLDVHPERGVPLEVERELQRVMREAVL